MISKRDLLSRIQELERQITVSVPVVNKDGDQIVTELYNEFVGAYKKPKTKRITIRQLCCAIQDMCGIEITYQEKSEGVVIYERDDD